MINDIFDPSQGLYGALHVPVLLIWHIAIRLRARIPAYLAHRRHASMDAHRSTWCYCPRFGPRFTATLRLLTLAIEELWALGGLWMLLHEA
jgi:hypothetical protein